MAFVTTDEYTAGRNFSLFGEAYKIGDVIPPSVIAQIKRPDTLLSQRYLVPKVDPHYRKTDKYGPGLPTPTPTHLPPSHQKAHAEIPDPVVVEAKADVEAEGEAKAEVKPKRRRRKAPVKTDEQA